MCNPLANKENTMSNIQSIPLNKLTASSRNLRRTNPAEGVEELAASIRAHGLLQNLTVIPGVKAKAKGNFEVIAGGRRLAALKLLAKEKKLAKDAPIPCAVLADGIAEEISLAENAMQCPMHPADQFEAFHALNRDHGMAAEDIAARFGVTPAVVRQRLKLAAVSPKLIALYRDEEMNLDQLTAFAICDDHARQERVWNDLPDWKRNRESILTALTEENVAATDPRAVFVGITAYEQAGGGILRDLFDPDQGGFLTDAELLNRLAREKLDAAAAPVRAEGWKWVETMVEYDYEAVSDLRRVWPEYAELDEQGFARLEEIIAEHDEIAMSEADDEESMAELARLEAEIEKLRGPEQYRPEDIAVAGAILFIDRDGELAVARGHVRHGDQSAAGNATDGEDAPATPDTPKAPPVLPEKLVAELTAYRTAGLQDALARSPEVALIAVVHAMALQAFFPYVRDGSALELRTDGPYLRRYAENIEADPVGVRLAERHAAWAERRPREPEYLWDFVTQLPHEERLALLAYCASRAVNAVEEKGSTSRAVVGDMLAKALGFDMASIWQPTVANYLGRISKDRILEAVREGVSPQAAKSLENMKKQPMAEAAEKVLSGTGWLPPPLRAA
jgi:ParB family chromosome partitioning protein